jgi:hypothetical protein
MDRLDEVIAIRERWAGRGERRLENGTKLICPAPHVAPAAWLHALFGPAQESQISSAESKCGIEFPREFRDFLVRTNGLFLFSNSISIWGIRTSYERVGDAAWQPFDIKHHNEPSERPSGSPEALLFFGSMGKGSEWCFFEPADEGHRVGKTAARGRFSPTAYWPDFWTWLLEQAHWLEGLFDQEGRPLSS